MTREEFNSLCQNCCSRKSISECLFADAEEGFIDTSAESDGSRGIAFSRRKMMVNLDGTIKIVAYKKIRSIHIIGSLEGAFADELEISGEHSRLRITDFSLDKHILKQIIEGLREGIEEPADELRENLGEPAAVRISAVGQAKTRENNNAENSFGEPADGEITADKQPEIKENAFVSEDKAEIRETPAYENSERIEPVLVKTSEKSAENDDILQEYEDKIEWLSDARDDIHDEKIEWLSSMTAEKAASQEIADSEIRGQIEQMSREETLGFLSKTLGEINGTTAVSEKNQEREPSPKAASQEIADSEIRGQIEQMSREETLGEINGTEPFHENNLLDDKPFFPTTQTAVIPQNAIPPRTVAAKNTAPNPPAEKAAAPAAPRSNGELSKEPIWGDIYIKASKNLRELCENGRLSMDIIETELREKLLDSAKIFTDIIKDEQKIPKTLVPKIAELKNAADHFDEYFSHGEDVGVRVMFFMLYQMLSYSDRIAENPETKERLNDFFRRFGTAGITLSMLDARV